ncbi:MAG: FAD-binding oxidoreductase [Rhodospirillales bacterium]|nr:FAD-binding oxidoreductase [Rhodospirillales bacterium]
MTGYSDRLVPGLRQSVILVQSLQIATAPLGPEDRRRILPEGQCVSDTRNLLRYFRVDRDHRLIVGGRGSLGPAHGPESFGLQRMMLAKLYPHLADAVLLEWLGGRVAARPLDKDARGRAGPAGNDGLQRQGRRLEQRHRPASRRPLPGPEDSHTDGADPSHLIPLGAQALYARRHGPSPLARRAGLSLRSRKRHDVDPGISASFVLPHELR